MIQQEFSSITLYITDLDHKRTENEFVSDSQLSRFCAEGFKTSTRAAFWIRRAQAQSPACVAWRFWLGAQNNKGGHGRGDWGGSCFAAHSRAADKIT